MRLNTKGWLVSVVAVSLVGFANAQPAQDPPTEGQQNEAAPQEPAAQPAPEGQAAQPAPEAEGQAGQAAPAVAPPTELTAQQDVQLTPQQMLTKAAEHIARIDQGSRSVRQQLSLARQERDVVKVLCLNDKLNQINVALASAIDRQRTLEAMVKENDADSARHEYTIISVLRNRA